MNTAALFLAWQDTASSRRWFPVGLLDANVERSLYRFRYTEGAQRARDEAGFPLLLEFPSLTQDYWSADLFPLFRNRVMNRARPDLAEYLHALDLAEETDPFEILAVSGGRRATDSYEVFPKIEKKDDGSFGCRFFLHGWRHVNREAQGRIDRLGAAERLYVTLELTNPVTGLAVQIQTEDYHMIGWAPRYLVRDLVAAMAESAEYQAQVVRVNPQPAPSKQRVLIEMRGRWESHQPMSHEDFLPLVESSADR
jgi:hypothetical protein